MQVSKNEVKAATNLWNDLQPHNHNLIPTRNFVISIITVSNLKLKILHNIQTITAAVNTIISFLNIMTKRNLVPNLW